MSEVTIAYLEDGREVSVLAQAGTYVVVRQIFEDFEEEGGPFVVDRVFDKPPVEARAAEIARLEKREQELHESIAKLLSEQYALQNLQVKFKNLSPTIEALDDFLHGRITHYVQVDPYGGFQILEAKNGGPPSEDRSSSWEHDTRLLALFGSSKGDLQWRANHYHDGSGSSWKTMHPCRSREDAMAVAQGILDGWVKLPEYGQRAMLADARKTGLTIPDGLAQSVSARAIHQAEAKVAEKKAELQSAEAALAKARGEVLP